MPFLDVYLPEEIPGYPCVSAPRTNTSIQVSAGGGESRNQNWEHPLFRFTMPEGIRDWSAVLALSKMWKITAGPFRSFAWRDPLDFASCDLAVPNPETDPVPGLTDQYLGTANGFTDSWQLVKLYGYGGETYTRTIHLPVLDTVRIAIDGVEVDPSDYTVSRPGGVVTFNVPPPLPEDDLPGTITAGFLFDVEVRFEDDNVFEAMLATWQAGGFSDLSLVEVRPC